ncbi:MAG: hypothetical protein ACAH07_02195 [Methylophilaceae bacterium]|nr:hypothetical protein [Methyloradius sp.]
MKRRPTIPFFEWRIAVHLERTKEIQKISGMPAYECKCELCETWKRSFEKVIPEQTLMELQRLGVQLNAPNELYAHPQDSSSRHVRAVFHIVGKIVSGPDHLIFHEKLNDYVQNYVPIRQSPWFSVRVVNAVESSCPSPSISNSKDGDVIALDFRFEL